MLNRLKTYSPIKRKLFICCFIILATILVIGVILILYITRVFYIRDCGINLKPSKNHELHKIQYYLQNDDDWASDLIGNTNRRMGGAGCLITCVASAMTDLGVLVTPKEVNSALSNNDGFQGADLIWYKIHESFPEIDYKYTRIFSNSTIENDLALGLLPIVNVKINGNGATHWLLVIGAADGEFLAYDPLNSDKEPIYLSKHGNVYSYRVLVRSNVP
jgi:hypothetical protein